MFKTVAERAWEKGKALRPTKFIPNGCGPAATGDADFVPDTLFGVKFGHECCDPHDLEYYRGGFWGLFTRKPRADYALAKCMSTRLLNAGAESRAAATNWRGKVKGYAQTSIAVLAGVIYGLAVTLFGWTPFTWRWKERELPTHKQLLALAEAIKAKNTD